VVQAKARPPDRERHGLDGARRLDRVGQVAWGSTLYRQAQILAAMASTSIANAGALDEAGGLDGEGAL